MKKSVLLLLIGIFFLSASQLLAQSWSTLGTAQFTNDPAYLATAIDESTGNYYVAYVDQSDNNHLKVKYYNGSAWTDLGGTISQLGDVLFPAIEINPATNEAWVVYRTDVSSSDRRTMLRRWDGSAWVDEGSNFLPADFFGNRPIPTRRMFLRFNPAGEPFVGCQFVQGSGSLQSGIYKKVSGNWNLIGNQGGIAYGLDYPAYDRAFFAYKAGYPTKTILQRRLFNGTNFNNATTLNQDDLADSNYEGLAANSVNSAVFTHDFNSNNDIDYYNFTTQLASPPNSTLTVGRTLRQEINLLDGRTYLAYATTNGNVVVSYFDGSAWTEITGLNANIGYPSTLLALDIRESDGRVFLTYKDGSSISTKYFDVTPAPTKVYVDQNASGNNDGTSWQDAFTSLHDGIAAAESSVVADTVWVADGTFKPTNGTDRSEKFTISSNGIKLFGGFAGTETELSERNVRNNPTIIDGDLNENDDPNDLTYGSLLRAENSYKLFMISGNDIEINGFTLTGGQADLDNGSTGHTGSAIYVNSGVRNFSIRDCEIAYNVTNRGGAIHTSFTGSNNNNLTIENNIFHHNIASYAAGFQAMASGHSLNLSVNNNLFYANKSVDLGSRDGIGASSFAAFANNGAINMAAVNNTFVNNVDKGTGTSDQATVVIRRLNDNNSNVFNADFHNNIFYENYLDDAGTSINPQNIGLMNRATNLINQINFTHNNTNQTNLATKASSSNITNNLDTDPLFLDEGNFDFALQVSSPMIDAGDNTQIPAGITTDLRGFTRTFNTTVDLGAYEYFVDNTAPTVVTQDIIAELDENGNVTIDPRDLDGGSTDDIVSSGDLTFTVDQSSFDCTEIGANTVTLTVSDVSGNTTTGTATVTVQDNLAPTVSPQDVTLFLDANGNATLDPADVDDGSSDNCGIASFTVLNNTTFDCSNLGENTDFFQVEDNAGSTASAQFTITVVDDIVPNAIAQDITIHLGEDGTAEILAEDLDNASTDNCSIASFSADKTSFDCTNLGANTVTLTVSDASGNTATATATVTVEDQDTPTIQTQDITIALDANGQATITPSQINNGSTDNCGIATYSLDIDTFDCSMLGENTVTLSAEDASGNTASANAVVTVGDDLAPEVLTQNITVSLDSDGLASITTSDIDNATSDNCGIASLSLDLTDFDCSHIGENTVTLTATDNNGNTATRTVIVTVEDDQAPTALTQNITVSLDENGQATITPAQVDNSSADNCGISTLSLDVDSFDCSMLGENTVNLTVTDAIGNSTSASAIVTVLDDIAPTVLTQDLEFALGEDQEIVISAEDVDAGSSDNCDFTISLDKTTFTLADLGENTVTLTVEDGSGNNATATALVIISEDKESQTIDFEPLPEKTFGADPFELTATASSGLAVSFSSSDQSVATIEGTTVTIVGAGISIITASQAGDDVYNAAEVSRELVVNKGNQEITVEEISDKDIEAADFEIVASTTSRLALSYEVLSGPATLNGNIVTLNGEVGIVEIEVSQAGNENYLAASATTFFEVFDNPCIGFTVTAETTDSNSIFGNGSISLTVTGGTGNYTYDWSNGETTANLSDLGIGEYTVTITDEAGCSITESYSIGGVTANREAFELNIYPNPVINQITISHGEKVKEISLMDANGKIILEQKASGKETLLEMTRLPAGMYFIRLDDGKMKRIIKE